MPGIDEMTLEEIEATMAKLRDRRKSLKKTDKASVRKIATLQRRRSRLLEQLSAIESQIEALQRESRIQSASLPRKRGRRPKSALIPRA